MDRPLTLPGPPPRRMAGSQWRGTVDDGLYCNDSDGTFSDATYEYGDDDDDDPVATDVRQMVGHTHADIDRLPPPAAAANDDAIDLHVRLMNEEAFAFMISRAQQARIYAAHAARAPESTPESTPEP